MDKRITLRVDEGFKKFFMLEVDNMVGQHIYSREFLIGKILDEGLKVVKQKFSDQNLGV